MSSNPPQGMLFGPPPVAVHNDGDVSGKVMGIYFLHRVRFLMAGCAQEKQAIERNL
jgi:hypothetical protein